MQISALAQRFTNVLRYLAKGGFLKAVAKLSGATALGQIISVLATLILTRLYTPQEFGFLAVFIALLSQLMVFTSLRYEWAIPPVKEDDTAFDLVLLCLVLVLGVSLLTTVSVAVGAEQIANWVKLPAIAAYLYLLPIAVFFVGCYQVFNYWGLRKKEFTLIAKSQVAKSIWTSGVQIGLGTITTGPIGLLIGAVVNQIAGTSSLIALFWQDYRKSTRGFSFNRLLKVASEQFNFAGLCITSSFFNYAAISAPTLLLAYFYTPDAVGAFSLAQRFSGIPAVFIGNAISQVYFATACQLVHSDPIELKRLHRRTTLLLFGISATACAGFFFSPWVVPIVFGERWREAGIMMQYMAPMLLFTIAVSPLTMLEWLERNTEILIWHVARLLLIIGGFFWAQSQHFSAAVSIGIFSLVTAIMYVVLLLLNHHAITQLINKHRSQPYPENLS
jgi:O-antigen/teichoic acid export membrane protein